MENHTQIIAEDYSPKEWQTGYIHSKDAAKNLGVSKDYLRDLQRRFNLRKGYYSVGESKKPNVYYSLKDIYEFVINRQDDWLGLDHDIVDLKALAIKEGEEVIEKTTANIAEATPEMTKQMFLTLMQEHSEQMLEQFKTVIDERLGVAAIMPPQRMETKTQAYATIFAVSVFTCVMLYAAISI